MGWEALIYVAVAVIAAVVSYVVAISSSSIPTIEQSRQDPRSDLMVTSVKEGGVIPVVYGTCRLAGNIIYYGDLQSVTHYEEQTVSGGKGGGGGSETRQVAAGYDYWIDVWEGICMGPVQILASYVADDPGKTIDATVYFNDGTNGVVPSVGPTPTTYSTKPTFTEVSGGWETYLTTGPDGIQPGSVSALASSGAMYDNGAGVMVSAGGVSVGTIDYATGRLFLAVIFVTLIATVGVSWTLASSTSLNIIHPTPLPGLAHIGYASWFMGTNATNIPSVSFAVKRTLPTTVNYANMTNGANPAAVIWDILTNETYGLGMDAAELNLATFNAAALVWYNKGYGINFVLDGQHEAQAIIEQVLGWVGGSFFMNNDGEFCIYAHSENDASVVTLDEDDFIEFSLDRPSWDSTYNDVRLDFFDASSDYVRKAISLFDSSNFRMQGAINQVKVDLSCFSDLDAVSRRGWEFLKNLSYPRLTFKFKLNQTKTYPLFAGCVVTIDHEDYGISGMKVRIIDMGIGEDSELEVTFSAEQMVEALFDASFAPIMPNIPYWEAPDYTPLPLPYSTIFELPWNPTTKDVPYYVMLGARAGIEDLCFLIKSIISSSEGYENFDTYTAFSQTGTLDVTYPATTYTIDDEVGIIYTAYRNDLNPSDYRRAELLRLKRFVRIDNEIMAFQVHDPYGVGSTKFQMLGVIRGLFGTTVAQHNVGARVWIFREADILKHIVDTQPFWIKMLPSSTSGVVDASAVTAIALTPTRIAKTPLPPTMLDATRDGSNNIVVTWLPIVREYTGAGYVAEDVANDTWPFDFDGDFEYKIGSGGTPVAISDCRHSFAQAGSLVFYVRHRIDSVYSSWVYVTVGASAGRYQSEIGAVSY